MPRKLLLPLAIVVACVVIVIGLYSSRPDAQKRSSVPEPVVQVDTQTIALTDETVWLPSRGLMTAFQSSTLSAQVSGEVIEVTDAARAQGQFQRGDSLIKIDDRDYRAALELAEANVQEAQVALQQEQAQAKQAERDWQRLNKDTAPSDLVLRKPQLAAAQAQLRAAKAQRDQAKLDLSRTHVRAPYSGASTALHVNVGQFVTTGTALADLAGLSPLEVSLPISAQWRDLLADPVIGSEVRLTTESGELVDAQIVRSAPVIDQSSRQIHLIARVDSQSAALASGDFVTADIRGKILSDVVKLPREAMVEGSAVWRIENERLNKAPVDVAWQGQEYVLVRSGLAEGDVVNITPLAQVTSGTKVSNIDDSAENNAEPVESTP